MAVTPKLEIRQSQSLLMTPQLRQAINLLQMSNIELAELVEQELQNNPLLEKEDNTFDLPDDNTLPTIDDYNEANNHQDEEAFAPDIDYNNQFDDFGSDCEGYDFSEDNYSWEDYNQRKNKQADNDFDYFEKKLKEEKNLFEIIMEQIGLHFSSKIQQGIAIQLTQQLDAAGYFRGDIAKLAQQLNVQISEIKNILSIMKTFEPTGIFAEDLSECLKIQLQDKNRLDPYMEKLLENLPLLAEKKYKELKKICQVDDEDLIDMINDIKALNPKPASIYLHEQNSYIIPDVFVRTNKNGNYIVELNNMTLPRLLINKRYYGEIQTKDHNKKTKQYIKEKLTGASFLVKALHQRAETILKVCEEIVRCQYDFFEKGIEYLKPMILRDVAENIEMHESTVSRVTNNKYILTPRGTFELKYFFSNAAVKFDGEENTSTLSIKHKIKKLIDEEEPNNILSDDKIEEILASQGIKIARRTIAKYRESMNIPTSGQRKREKRNLLQTKAGS